MSEITRETFYKDKRRQLKRIIRGDITLAEAMDYADEDSKSQKIAKEFKAELKEGYNDYLDSIIYQILDVLSMREKWTISADLEMSVVYPQPILNGSTVGIEYKPYKHYLFTDEELYNRFIELEDNRKRAGYDASEKLTGYNISKRLEAGFNFQEIAEQFYTSDMEIYKLYKYYKDTSSRYNMRKQEEEG